MVYKLYSKHLTSKLFIVLHSFSKRLLSLTLFPLNFLFIDFLGALKSQGYLACQKGAQGEF